MAGNQKKISMRFDVYLVEMGCAKSRVRAKELIEGGKVTLDGRTVTKASFAVADGAHTVEVTEELPYVSRGGLKLEAALHAFSIHVDGANALDVGASTGGFTDCLLQHGAASVCAVDAGQGQLDAKLCQDARVRSYEHMNARELMPEMVGGVRFDLIVMDVSFISATYILPRFPALLREGGDAVVLIKPQFEVGRALLGKGGVVRDPAAHKAAILRVVEAAETSGLTAIGLIASPIEGGDGNREFLIRLVHRDTDLCAITPESIERVIRNVADERGGNQC